jgi:hypothetical protein
MARKNMLRRARASAIEHTQRLPQQLRRWLCRRRAACRTGID